MRNRRIDQEKLENVLKELEGKLVIVEGKKDKKALKSLGVKDIIAINGRPLYEVADSLLKTEKEIVILTDFDKKGRQIEMNLKDLLKTHGKKTNSKLRWKVMSLGKNKIEDFGNMRSPYSFKEDDFHVKISTNFDKIRDKGKHRRKGSNREA